MRKVKVVIFTSFCLLCIQLLSAQSIPDLQLLKGVWCSELESSLEIQELNLETGEIGGTYTSPVGGGLQSFPLVGWVNSKPPTEGKDNVHVVSFAVRWGELGSITSWTGTFQYNDSEAPILKMVWHLARPTTDFPFEHVITQGGEFRYGKCEE